MAWTHSCLAINSTSGLIKLYENGNLAAKKIYDDLPSIWIKLAGTFDFVSVGCAFRNEGSKNMSMQGRITDFQANPIYTDLTNLTRFSFLKI